MTVNINGTSGISGVDGSAGTPALQGTDSNTGISFGADTVNVNTGGTTRATVDSSGRLLVGTTTTSADVRSIFQARSGDSSGHTNVLLASGSSSPADGAGLGFLTFSDSGHTTSAWIHAARDGGTWSGSSKPTRLVFSTTADGASSPTERMRIDNLGRSMMNQTSVTDFAALSISFNSGASSTAPATGLAINQTNASTGTIVGFRNSSGTVIGSISNNNNGTVTYNTSSDYRLKENIVDLDGAIDRLQAIPVRRFNFIGFPDKVVDGFVAHEIQKVVPEAVTGAKDAEDADGNPIYQGIDQSKLVPLLTAALQEAIAKIETLETRLTALEGGAAQ